MRIIRWGSVTITQPAGDGDLHYLIQNFEFDLENDPNPTTYSSIVDCVLLHALQENGNSYQSLIQESAFVQ